MQTPSQTQLVLPSRTVLWRPTAALAGVNAAITLSWIIYRVHLAGLLTQAGFPATFAPVLLLLETILAIVIEPWAGSTSDRTFQRFGNRFSVILTGVGLTALLFLLLPGIVNFLQPNASANWWLPGLLVVWAIAISLFRSPALALLENYAAPKQLPVAASLITLAGALAGSATPLASPWLLGLGVTVTFVAAAALLLITMGWLQVAQPPAALQNEFPAASPQLPLLIRIFGLGLAATLVFKLAVELFPKMLKAAGMKPPAFMGVLFISLAVGALLAGWMASRWGNAKTIRLGLGLTAACLILLTLTHTPITAALTAAAFGLSFSLILNGTLPFALNFMPWHQAGLSVGLFFSGAAAANSLYSGILGQPGVLSPITSTLLGLVALLVVGLCVMGQTASIKQHQPSEN